MGCRTFPRQMGGSGTSRRRESYCNKGWRSTQLRYLGWQMKCPSFLQQWHESHTLKGTGPGVIPLERSSTLPPILILPLSHLHFSCICPSWSLCFGKTPITEQDKMSLILTCKKRSALYGTKHLPTFIVLQIWGTMNKWGSMHMPQEQQHWATIKKKKSKRAVTVVLNRADTEQTLCTMWRVI